MCVRCPGVFQPQAHAHEGPGSDLSSVSYICVPLQSKAESYTNLMSRALGLTGVCEMMEGRDMDEAYHLLQKSARCVWICMFVFVSRCISKYVIRMCAAVRRADCFCSHGSACRGIILVRRACAPAHDASAHVTTPPHPLHAHTHTHTRRMAGKPVWICHSSSRLGAFHLHTGRGGGARTAMAVWEETIDVSELTISCASFNYHQLITHHLINAIKYHQLITHHHLPLLHPRTSTRMWRVWRATRRRWRRRSCG
jgi:hypothetical protein